MTKVTQSTGPTEGPYVTTIRDYCPELVDRAIADGWLPSWLDRPVAVVDLARHPGHSVWCGGRAIVGFYSPDKIATTRPAYIVISEPPSPQIGRRLVQSA
jgi:hypothetical protein